MSRQRIYWDTRERESIHRTKLMAKIQKIEGLKAILDMWELHPDKDHDYIRALRARLRSAEHQLAAMKP